MALVDLIERPIATINGDIKDLSAYENMITRSH